METSLHDLNLTELAERIRPGSLSPLILAEKIFSRIERLDGHLKAFQTITRERALNEAAKAEREIKSGRYRGPCHGIPYAVKDLFDVKGQPTMAGCRLLADNKALKNSAAVSRLLGAGMVLAGKTHTVQFAFGGVGINHDLGTPHNPWKAEPYVPGGSSSGSAVAVASGMVPIALGTDTGGSVRIPAALCGTVGLKTTVGTISRAGVYPLSWTFDSVGVLARSVEDTALVLRTLKGPDPEDETTFNVGPTDVLVKLKEGVKGLKLAFAETVFFDEVDPEIQRAVRASGEVFQSLGARVESMEVPEVSEAHNAEKRALMIAAEACVINEKFLRNHCSELDPVVAERMKAGQDLSAPEYLSLLRHWQELRISCQKTLKDVDALLVPTTMIPARPLAEVDSSLETYFWHNGRYLRNTSLGNILNWCAVSVPCGFTREGLPIGLMIYAKPFQEDLALRVAYAYEQATDWHNRHPDLSWAT